MAPAICEQNRFMLFIYMGVSRNTREYFLQTTAAQVGPQRRQPKCDSNSLLSPHYRTIAKTRKPNLRLKRILRALSSSPMVLTGK